MKDERFIEKFSEHQQRIYSFILSLAPNWNEAEDIFQRTSIVLWRKWDEYDPDRNFLNWALGVSRLEFLKYVSEKKRSQAYLSEDAVSAIHSRYVDGSEPINKRMEALEHCLKKLPERKRTLLDRCYGGTEKIMDIAQAIGVSSDALYWRIKRIRELLHDCVDKLLTAEE